MAILLADVNYPVAANIVGFVLVAVVALLAGISDGRFHRISNKITYPAIVAGFLFHAFAGLAAAGVPGMGAGLKEAFTGFSAAFVPFFVLYVIGVVQGAADVKVMGAFGALLADWIAVLHAMFYGFIAACLIALGIIVARGLLKKTLSNIAMMATQVAAKSKPQVISVGPPIGLAMGLSIGAVLAALETFLGVVMPWGKL